MMFIKPLLALAGAYLFCTPALAAESYSVQTRLSGPATSGWDYASIDAKAKRLYLAAEGVLVLDLASGKVISHWPAGKMPHAALPIGRGLVALSDGGKHVVQLLDATSGKPLHTIPTGAGSTATSWHNPDGVVQDTKTGMLVAVNGDSGDLVLIDVQKHAVVGTIKLKTKLEAAAVDGTGKLYVNLAEKNAIAVVDLAKRTVLKTITLKGCEEPTGIVVDTSAGLVASVCGNGVAKFFATNSLTEVASLAVAKGADDLIFDAKRHTAFVPGGEDGTLSVIRITSAADIKVVQTIKTAIGVRLGAVNLDTGTVYLPSVNYDLKAPPVKLPGMPPFPRAIPATFEFLLVGLQR